MAAVTKTGNAQVERVGADATTAITSQPLPADDDAALEADDGTASESGYKTDGSEATSISSSIYAGYLENGRRYQTKREGYYIPADDKQFEHMSTIHVMYQILESQQENRFFRAPIPANAQNILDIGTGNGDWARDVADLYPSAIVHGIDLYPPPNTWVPPNCILEVDDALKPWTFSQKFDLIHLRLLTGSFEEAQWAGVYKQAYANLAPGGWIEQVEVDPRHYSDDGTLPLDSALATMGDLFLASCASSGRPADTADTMRAKIEAAGFINVHEKTYKVPSGDWARNPILKEAGKFNLAQFLEGLEGFTIYVLTHFGVPKPWSVEEVQVFLAQVRKDLNAGYHNWQKHRRVWAQKPFE